MSWNAIFAATAVSAAFATIFMAFFANYPIALASGMGLNAYFAYTVVPQLAQQGITNPWQVALTAILIEGIIFIILSIFKFRETLVNKVPANLKYGISAGIGLFITMIGLKGANVTVSDDSTLLALGDLGSPTVVLALVGLLIVAALWHFRVKGAILIGIIATWLLGIVAQLAGWYVVDVDAGVYSLIPSFDNYLVFAPVQEMATQTMFKFDFGYIASNFVNFAVIVFAFLFVDLFDTVGTLIGVAQEGKLLNENGELPRVGRALMADAVGTCAGACLGTSTVTSYVESTTGVAEGGRTGLTALTSGILFLLALPLYPIFSAIPSFATTPALVFVGLLMLKNVTKMNFEDDIADTVGGFLAVIMMPFAYSIATGIMFGIISWVVLKVVMGKIKDIHPVMWVAFALFVVRIITIVMGISS
jgi:AGZA family xanthine/uracil permease-like MFS transporter